MKHVISVSDFVPAALDFFVREAWSHELPYERRQRREPTGKLVTLLFTEASTRTRGSNEEAARLLGLDRYIIAGSEATSLVKNESYSATARMLALQNTSVLVIRTPVEGAPRWLAEMLERYGYDVAIHNAGDGANQHPTQAVLDLVTLQRQFDRISGLRIGIVGDLKNSRTVHSLVQALRLIGEVELVLVSSPEVALQPWYTEGLNVSVSDSLDALTGCDVVYVTRVQRERFASEYDYLRVRGKYVINAAVLERLGPEVKIMHPQPVADGEVAPEIWNHPQVIMDRQAGYGVPARMALLQYSLMDVRTRSAASASPPTEQIVSEESIEERLKQKRAEGQYFTPIAEGTVIDHLPVEAGELIWGILKRVPRGQQGVSLLAAGLRSKRLPSGYKSSVVLEQCFLAPEERATIAFLAPTATFNEFRGGLARKIKVVDADALRGVGTCPNPACVTRLDPEAALHPAFHTVAGGDGQVRCHFCEQHFPKAKLFLT